jgi:hypothetical protein
MWSWVVVVFLSTSKEIKGSYLDYITIASYQLFPKSSLTNSTDIWRHAIWQIASYFV